RTTAADKNAALAFREWEKGGAIGNADFGCGGKSEAAADHCPMQGGDGGNRTARNNVEYRVPSVVALFSRQRRFYVFQELCEVETGGKVQAMAEDDAGIRLIAGAPHRIAQLRDHGVVDGVALVRTVQADDRNRAIEFIGDKRRGHGSSFLWTKIPLQCDEMTSSIWEGWRSGCSVTALLRASGDDQRIECGRAVARGMHHQRIDVDLG